MPRDELAVARERLGQVLRDRWLLEQTLGVGGMAAVYAARHRNGARAAIKLLHGPLREDAVMKERFLREAYLANTVGHPGIVRVLDDDEDPQFGPFLIMELLEGDSIDELFRKKINLPVDKVLDVADQTLDVLAAAHDKGIVHRDLKPANLFLCRDGTVKVLDFGIARLLHDNVARLTATGMMMGTPAYMAPEQARTSGKLVDGRSDLYAVGATMFRILAGRHAHTGKLAQLIVQVATERAPKLGTVAPHVPPAVCAIVDRACEFEPERRYPTARDMQTDVRHVRAGHAPPIASRSLGDAPQIPSLPSLDPLQPRTRSDRPPPSSQRLDPVTAAAQRARDEARALAAQSDFHGSGQQQAPRLANSDQPTVARQPAPFSPGVPPAPPMPSDFTPASQRGAPPSGWHGGTAEPTARGHGSPFPAGGFAPGQDPTGMHAQPPLSGDPRNTLKSTQFQVAPSEHEQRSSQLPSLASTQYAMSPRTSQQPPQSAPQRPHYPAIPAPGVQPHPQGPPNVIVAPSPQSAFAAQAAFGQPMPSSVQPQTQPVPTSKEARSKSKAGCVLGVLALLLVVAAVATYFLRAYGILTFF
jgi:serine/threonine protein kinase